MQLITTKPTIYLVNLTMKDYLRQKSKYLPLIAKWVTEHGGLPRDIIPFSIEFEEKVYSFKGDKEGLEEWLKENGGGKVRSRLEKIVTEGRIEGRRARGRQRMKYMDSLSQSENYRWNNVD